MTTFRPKELVGSLFKVEDRQSEKSPNYSGSCLIDGQTYKISAWVNETREGKKFMKLGFQRHELARKASTYGDDIQF
jgi:hypothetical protein